MAEVVQKAPEPDPALKKQAILEYHDAKTREEKAQVVEKYPFLKQLYSEVNHS